MYKIVFVRKFFDVDLPEDALIVENLVNSQVG